MFKYLKRQAGDFIKKSKKKLASSFSPSGSPTLPKTLTIEGRRVKFCSYMDEGGFSYVYKVLDSNGTHYALKRLMVQSREQLSIVNNEINTMKRNCCGTCSHLIRYYGSYQEKQSNIDIVYLLLEYGEYSILDKMNELHSLNTKFTEKQILRIFHDTCLGIKYLHDHEVVHRDIKIENILYVGGEYKLCDFGSCTTKIYDFSRDERSVAEDDISKNTTLEYRSPEMIDLYSGVKIGKKSDIWALGCVLYKLCFFRGPFDDAGSLQIINCKYVMKGFEYGGGVEKVIRRCLASNPKKRYSIDELIVDVEMLMKGGKLNQMKLSDRSKKSNSFRDIRKRKKKKKNVLFHSLGKEQIEYKSFNGLADKKDDKLFEKLDWSDNTTKLDWSDNTNDKRGDSKNTDFTKLDWSDNTTTNKTHLNDIFNNNNKANTNDDISFPWDDDNVIDNNDNKVISSSIKNEKSEQKNEEKKQNFFDEFDDFTTLNLKKEEEEQKKPKKNVRHRNNISRSTIGNFSQNQFMQQQQYNYSNQYQQYGNNQQQYYQYNNQYQQYGNQYQNNQYNYNNQQNQYK